MNVLCNSIILKYKIQTKLSASFGVATLLPSVPMAK